MGDAARLVGLTLAAIELSPVAPVVHYRSTICVSRSAHQAVINILMKKDIYRLLYRRNNTWGRRKKLVGEVRGGGRDQSVLATKRKNKPKYLTQGIANTDTYFRGETNA